ncbi:MAG: transcriptional repressor [Lautropia sp. SCN 66-9]|nr:MAG: transcriptional repressor [Lautropia sp. SCN 66-9]
MERSTRQRAAIREALDAAGRPLLPQEVHEAARRQVPALGLATVYRTLKALLDEGMIQIVTLPGDNPRYESRRDQHHHHHHHFQCTECLRVFDIEDCPGDMRQFVPPGFTVARHELTLYGQCGDCGRQTAARASTARRKKER